MPDDSDQNNDSVHYFVDESGQPTLFSARGEVIVGKNGCSEFFMMGKVEVDDPQSLSDDLQELRKNLLSDPYFKDVPSMQPEERKTAIAFHAKDDLPEIRYEVFKLLRRHNISFFAVVRDKFRIVEEVRQRIRRESGYRFRENELYDALVTRLFNSGFYKANVFHICFAERGSSTRTAALQSALGKAKDEFQQRFGFASPAAVHIKPSTPKETACLQAVDYYLWAVQRFFEKNEDRFLDVIWPQTKLVHDLDDLRENSYGAVYSPQKPLTRESRAKKSRRI